MDLQRKSQKERFNEEGYIVIPKLFSGKELQTILETCERIHGKYAETAAAAGKEFKRINCFTNPKYIDRPEDLKTLLELAADPRILGPVEQIFEGESVYRSITYWVNPKTYSEEGRWHRDGQGGMTAEEQNRYILGLQDKGLVRGVQFQISLVDNSDLEYVPYTVQRTDSPEEHYYRLADKGAHSNAPVGMPNALRFHLKAGDAVAFNQVGIHRGRYHADKPRRTLMLTYLPKNNLLFDKVGFQPWLLNEGFLDGLSARAKAFYGEFIRLYRDHYTALLQSAASISEVE